jgi:hypothetical protein
MYHQSPIDFVRGTDNLSESNIKNVLWVEKGADLCKWSSDRNLWYQKPKDVHQQYTLISKVFLIGIQVRNFENAECYVGIEQINGW